MSHHQPPRGQYHQYETPMPPQAVYHLQPQFAPAMLPVQQIPNLAHMILHPNMAPQQHRTPLTSSSSETKKSAPATLPLHGNEPIEAGNLRNMHILNKKILASNVSSNVNKSTGASSTISSRKSLTSSTWESITDEERELQLRQYRKEEAYKTALCDAYKKRIVCPYGDACRFAHGENELRMPSQPRGKSHPKYKTQLCDKFSMYGTCPYGPRCQFIHKLKKGLPLLEYNRLLNLGKISPAKENEIVNPDEEGGFFSRRRCESLESLLTSGGRRGTLGGRRSLHVIDIADKVAREQNNDIFPCLPMQVVNIERAMIEESKQKMKSDAQVSTKIQHSERHGQNSQRGMEPEQLMAKLQLDPKNCKNVLGLTQIVEEPEDTSMMQTVDNRAQKVTAFGNWYQKTFGGSAAVSTKEPRLDKIDEEQRN